MPFEVGSPILETFEKKIFATQTIGTFHDGLLLITASKQNDIPECKSVLEISPANDNTSGFNYTERQLYWPDSWLVDRWRYNSNACFNRR